MVIASVFVDRIMFVVIGSAFGDGFCSCWLLCTEKAISIHRLVPMPRLQCKVSKEFYSIQC